MVISQDEGMKCLNSRWPQVDLHWGGRANQISAQPLPLELRPLMEAFHDQNPTVQNAVLHP